MKPTTWFIPMALILAIGLAQSQTRTLQPCSVAAERVSVITFQAATRPGIQAQLEAWLRDNRNRGKCVLTANITRDTTPFETLGSRGSEPVYTGVIAYAAP
jgi:hypothetical protein